MRAWAVLVVAMLGAGCPQPKCECGQIPELGLIWTQDGVQVGGDSGSVPLDPPTRGCARKTRLTLRNNGRSAATGVSISTNSPSITAHGAPGTLGAGEAQAFDLLVQSDALSSGMDAELTVDLEGQPSLHFQAHAAIVEPDPSLTRQFDFGGVEVGATRSLTAPALVGLSDDFSQVNGELTFAPVDAGIVQRSATRESMLDCPSISGVTLLADGVPSVLTGPAAVDFGDVVVGSALEFDVSIQNLSFDEVLVTLPASDFTIVSMSTTPSIATRDQRGVLVPGSRTQRIHYAPTMPGAATSQLEATAGNRRLVIPVRAGAVP